MKNIHTHNRTRKHGYIMIGNGFAVVDGTDIHLLYNIWCE